MLTTAYNNSLWLRNRIVEHVRATAREDRGAAMVEYAFLFTLIVIVTLLFFIVFTLIIDNLSSLLFIDVLAKIGR